MSVRGTSRRAGASSLRYRKLTLRKEMSAEGLEEVLGRTVADCESIDQRFDHEVIETYPLLHSSYRQAICLDTNAPRSPPGDTTATSRAESARLLERRTLSRVSRLVSKSEHEIVHNPCDGFEIEFSVDGRRRRVHVPWQTSRQSVPCHHGRGNSVMPHVPRDDDIQRLLCIFLQMLYHRRQLETSHPRPPM